MPDLVYGTAAIERARTAVAAAARTLPAAADHVTGLPGPALGGLDAAAGVAAALTELTHALDAELMAGGARLDQADRALDAALASLRGSDTASARSLGAAGSGAAGSSGSSTAAGGG